MKSKRIIFALVFLLMSATGYAADGDNTKPAAADGKSSPSDAASFYQGVWVGKWPWGGGVDTTITVGKKGEDGLFGTTYTWGQGRNRTGGTIDAGSLKAWGKDQGDKFLIEWKNKQGVKFSITLFKRPEDKVKAVYDSDGPLTITDRSYLETYLTRK